MNISIHTLGCKVSQYESAAIGEMLEKRGHNIVSENEKADIRIINTCTVTAASDRKCRQAIRNAAKDASVCVIGCYSQLEAEAVKKIDGVIYLGGTENKLNVVDFIDNYKENQAQCVHIPEISGFEDMKITKFDRTRAYIKIEDGCSSHCSYCIIPKARGPVRCKGFNGIIKEAEEIIRGGCKEIVLTGIEIDKYNEEGNDLGDLILALDKLDGDFRIRLGSLDISFVTDRFINKIKNAKKLAPHFHLSLQSGSSKILAAMKRRYNKDMALRAFSRLREEIEGVAFTTDIICGFPTETDEDFNETCEVAKEARFIHIHAFPYSDRSGTVASKMQGKIEKSLKSERVARLTRLGDEILKEEAERLIKEGKLYSVLFETYENGIAYGHTASFFEVAVKSRKALSGEIHTVLPKKFANGKLISELMAEQISK